MIFKWYIYWKTKACVFLLKEVCNLATIYTTKTGQLEEFAHNSTVKNFHRPDKCLKIAISDPRSRLGAFAGLFTCSTAGGIRAMASILRIWARLKLDTPMLWANPESATFSIAWIEKIYSLKQAFWWFKAMKLQIINSVHEDPTAFFFFF